jgi:hypothetical protein
MGAPATLTIINGRGDYYDVPPLGVKQVLALAKSDPSVPLREGRSTLAIAIAVAFLWLGGHHFGLFWHISLHPLTTSKLLTVQRISDFMGFRKLGAENFKTAAIDHSATPPQRISIITLPYWKQLVLLDFPDFLLPLSS